MKKTVFLIAVSICSCYAVFAQTYADGKATESWFSLGPEFGVIFESFDDVNIAPGKQSTYLGSPGANASGYSFSNKRDIGVFYHYSFLFPLLSKGDGDLDEYDGHFEFLFGVAFKHNLGKKGALHFGIGFDFAFIYANNTETLDMSEYGYGIAEVNLNKLSTNLGAGAVLGIKLDFTDRVYIDFGAALSYLFFNVTSYDLSVSGEIDEYKTTTRITLFDDSINNYTIFTVRPYIAIGFNSWSISGRGKLKEANS